MSYRAITFCLLSYVVLAPFALSAKADDRRLTVMGFNVENFFDDFDDPRVPNGTNAEVINTSEWVARKGAAVARVIHRFDHGKGPDILVLSELESELSLKSIADNLAAVGLSYPTRVLIDANPGRPVPKPDRRGIKVALLSRLAMPHETMASALPVDLSAELNCNDDDGATGSTRDLLQVDLTLPDGAPLTVIGGHLPSGRNPLACRSIAAKTIAAFAQSLPQDRIVIAAGDFNFNCAPAEQAALRLALAGWLVPPQTDNHCTGEGSQYFGRDKTWSFLDVIAQRSTSAGKWTLDLNTFRSVLVDFEQFYWDEEQKVMRPKAFRFNANTLKSSGTSDHWPVAIDLIRSD